MRANRAAAATAALAAIAAAFFGGRWEENRAIEREQARIEAAFALVGGEIDAPTLSGYRVTDLDCLYYDLEKRRYAVTLCFDAAGRLVESADRRGAEPTYSSVRLHPESAPATVDPNRVRALLRRIGAPPS